MNEDRFRKGRIADDLQEVVEEAGKLARKLGLEPYPVNYWIVDHDEMNELIAYDGFQRRYPHWRWGMKYDRQRKEDRFGAGKAFEIVNNDNPSHAFLQESNSMADQKAVITHVEAHADFFANNEWFGLFGDDDPDAAALLERHARTIRGYMDDPDIDREAIERWIDHLLTLEDNIDQHRAFSTEPIDGDGDAETVGEELREKLSELDVSDEVQSEVFDEEWLAAQEDGDGPATVPDEPEYDLLAFLRDYGRQYDAEAGKAVEFDPWQRDVIELLREEAYYFAAQKMSKIMNEGWASYWESMMMSDEGFAGEDEFVLYADHMARVLGSSGLNPYKLGFEIWQYVENRTNRREVIDKLLRVEGITWRNLTDAVDLDRVQSMIEPPDALVTIDAESLDRVAALPDGYVDREALERARAGKIDVGRYPWKLLTYAGLARRHFSLAKRANRGFLARISQSDLERISRYMFDADRYASVEEAIEDVDFTAGWDRLFDVRESHNDVTFLDAFLTQEFVDENDYFTYEHSRATGDYRVASTGYEDVKKKLLLQFTNFGKPTIAVYDANYENRNELLLGHEYNGVALDVGQARETLKGVFELWGRPVNLKTIVKEVDDHDVEVAKRRGREPEPEEVGKLLRYDGEAFTIEDLPWEAVEHLAADDVDYDTKPDEWLA
ncbi:AbrB family transcriptional regulator [Halobacteriales archaeon SW_7_68_16]|nr:MAG: AbrB family transcriptional regulator [Halobacteriales archaeon SW_7_68_16]